MHWDGPQPGNSGQCGRQLAVSIVYTTHAATEIMRGGGTMAVCCWWTLLDILFTTYVPVNSGYGGGPMCRRTRAVTFLTSVAPVDHRSAARPHGPSDQLSLVGLCESAWYRDLLQGLCHQRAGLLAPPPPRLRDGAAPEKDEGVVSVPVDEWTKNFASPDCGAKLGRFFQSHASVISELLSVTQQCVTTGTPNFRLQ